MVEVLPGPTAGVGSRLRGRPQCAGPLPNAGDGVMRWAWPFERGKGVTVLAMRAIGNYKDSA
jgi:hypothetical protein